MFKFRQRFSRAVTWVPAASTLLGLCRMFLATRIYAAMLLNAIGLLITQTVHSTTIPLLTKTNQNCVLEKARALPLVSHSLLQEGGRFSAQQVTRDSGGGAGDLPASSYPIHDDPSTSMQHPNEAFRGPAEGACVRPLHHSRTCMLGGAGVAHSLRLYNVARSAVQHERWKSCRQAMWTHGCALYAHSPCAVRYRGLRSAAATRLPATARGPAEAGGRAVAARGRGRQPRTDGRDA